MQPPSAAALVEILGPRTRVARRVDVYESDGVTPWMLDAPVRSGKVSVDSERDERRTLEVSFDNQDGAFSADYEDSGFWFDKIIKPFRGVYITDEEDPEMFALGEFMIDDIRESDFPDSVSVTGRDFAKLGLKSKFELPTTFESGESIEAVIEAIAFNAGYERMLFPLTGLTLGREYLFESGTERWRAMKDIATAFNHELFMDAHGYLVLQPFRDPAYSAELWAFETGEFGSVLNWTKSAKDDRLYNHVFVTGESNDAPLVWAEARNDDLNSPARIDNIGDRLYTYTSAFVTTEAQAQELADNFLKVFALESWELNFGNLVFPWFEAGEVITFADPKVNETHRWRLSNFNIPLDLSPMDALARRVELIVAPDAEEEEEVGSET